MSIPFKFQLKYMKYVTFYLLSEEDQKNHGLHYILQLICNIINTQWRLGKTILVTCENKHQASKIDEILWTTDNVFLPHNLFGINMVNAPVLIYWKQCYYNNIQKDLLINLIRTNLNFFLDFNEIIDFVPITETLKTLARTRYKCYKKLGFQLKTINAPKLYDQ